MRFHDGINFLSQKHLEFITPVCEAASFSQIFVFRTNQKTRYSGEHFGAVCPPLPLTCSVTVGQSPASPGTQQLLESNNCRI